MNSKLHAKIVTMAAATLGLGIMSGCAKKSEPEPTAAEGGATAAGSETSCGGAHGCGGHHEEAKGEGASTGESTGESKGEGSAESGDRVGNGATAPQ